MDGEAATGVVIDCPPGLHDVRGVSDRHRGMVQELPPLREILLYLARAGSKVMARPNGVLLQIPSQFLRLDGANGSDKSPWVRASHFWLFRRSRLVDEPGACRGTTGAVLLLEF